MNPSTIRLGDLEVCRLGFGAMRLPGKDVWGEPFRRSDRSVDVYVGKLRQKLEEALPGQAFIHTHFGFGYRFTPERIA